MEGQIEFDVAGRKAILENIRTWRCSEPDSLKYVQENLADLVVTTMGAAADLRVPLEVNLSSGASWADAKS